MADDDNDARAYERAARPAPDLERLSSRLLGTWEISGDVRGTVTYEWMEGGFFLVQGVDLGQQDGQRITGIEVIGHERPFGAEPSEEIKSRFYSNTGDTIDYVYELKGDTLTIWVGERNCPAYYRGTFGDEGDTLTGASHYPGATFMRRLPPGSGMGWPPPVTQAMWGACRRRGLARPLFPSRDLFARVRGRKSLRSPNAEPCIGPRYSDGFGRF
jgi:hypothetical protein